MRRPPAALASLVVVALTAAACGGSGNSSESPSTAKVAAPSGSGEAAGILGAIDTNASTGPQKLKLDLTVDVEGTPTNQQLALFTKQPIHLGLDGVVDSEAKSADVNVSLGLGGTPTEVSIRSGDGKSWIKVDDKWYVLPADALSSTTGAALPTSAGNLDAAKILAAIGDPAKLLDNASVSSEKVEGVDSDKVSGDVNMPGLANALANISESIGGGTAKPPTQAELDKSVATLEKAVKKAHVDLWVGKSDHKVHRVAFAVDAAMDAATQKSQGIDSLTLNLDLTTVDSLPPDVSEPSSVGSAQEFQTALMTLLGKVVGGAGTG